MATPTLLIEEEDYAFIRAAVTRAGSKEVGGMGVVVFDEEGNGYVAHCRLLRQKISASEVEWDEDAHADYLEWLYTPEDNGGAGFKESKYGIYSWHSHGNMNVFWSGTDEDFIKKVGITVPWVFSSVFNTKKEITNRLDVFSEMSDACPLIEASRTQITWKECELQVCNHVDADPILDNVLAIEEKYDLRIEELKTKLEDSMASLEEKKKEETKPLYNNLKKVTESVHEVVKVRLDDEWGKYVTIPLSTTASTGANYPRQTTVGQNTITDRADRFLGLPLTSSRGDKRGDHTNSRMEDVYPGMGYDNEDDPNSSGAYLDGYMHITDDDVIHYRDNTVLSEEYQVYDRFSLSIYKLSLGLILMDPELVILNSRGSIKYGRVYKRDFIRLSEYDKTILVGRPDYTDVDISEEIAFVMDEMGTSISF